MIRFKIRGSQDQTTDMGQMDRALCTLITYVVHYSSQWIADYILLSAADMISDSGSDASHVSRHNWPQTCLIFAEQMLHSLETTTLSCDATFSHGVTFYLKFLETANILLIVYLFVCLFLLLKSSTGSGVRTILPEVAPSEHCISWYLQLWGCRLTSSAHGSNLASNVTFLGVFINYRKNVWAAKNWFLQREQRMAQHLWFAFTPTKHRSGKNALLIK